MSSLSSSVAAAVVVKISVTSHVGVVIFSVHHRCYCCKSKPHLRTLNAKQSLYIEKEHKRKSNTKKQKRKKSHEPWAYAVSTVFWIHIKLKFGPHKRGTSIQVQILYKFKIQFNYWINFKFSSNGKQHFFRCVCCWDCKLYNSNKNFRANLIRMSVCRMGDSIFLCYGFIWGIGEAFRDEWINFHRIYSKIQHGWKYG